MPSVRGETTSAEDGQENKDKLAPSVKGPRSLVTEGRVRMEIEGHFAMTIRARQSLGWSVLGSKVYEDTVAWC